ncbi:MAG: amidase, partial [Dehalococcoidia bacterium]
PRRHFYEEAEADVLVAVEEAIGVLAELGASVQEVEVPSIGYAQAALLATIMTEATTYHLPLLADHAHEYRPDVRLRLEAGALFTAPQYVQAQRIRSLLLAEMGQTLQQVDILATPTTAIAAPKLEDSTVTIDVTRVLTRCTGPFNLTGLPALSVPCGFNAQGMPLAMQLVGRPFHEETLLRAAHTYQRHTDWHTRRPPL